MRFFVGNGNVIMHTAQYTVVANITMKIQKACYCSPVVDDEGATFESKGRRKTLWRCGTAACSTIRIIMDIAMFEASKMCHAVSICNLAGATFQTLLVPSNVCSELSFARPWLG